MRTGKKIAKLHPPPVILSKLPVILSEPPVILSKAKNPAMRSETLRFAQGDKGKFRNFLNGWLKAKGARKKVARLARFELTTSASAGQRSIL